METKRRPYLFYGSLAAVFLLSRLLVRQAGVTFIDEIIFSGWQLLDTELLRQQLTESLWYLHSQPPLYNLLAGLVLKASGEQHVAVFAGIYLLLGLATTLLLAHALRTAGVSKTLSFVITVLFFCSPASILYENWGFYTHLEVFGITGLLWAGVCYFKTGQKKRYLVLLFAFAAGLCLTRSMFHWSFFAALTVLMVLFSQKRKQVWLTGGLAFLPILAWYTKNALLFGTFTASTWGGMNFVRMSPDYATPLGQIGVWADIATYDSVLHFGPAPYPVEAITAAQKRNGANNYNHYGYIEVSKRFGEEAWVQLKKKPDVYRENVNRAFFIFFEPPSQLRFGFLKPNYDKLGPLNRLYHFGYAYPTAHVGKDLIHINLTLYILVTAGAILLFFLYKDKDTRAVLLLALFLLLFVFVIGILLELGENNRFRFITVPPVLLLAGMELQALFRFFSQKRRLRSTR